MNEKKSGCTFSWLNKMNENKKMHSQTAKRDNTTSYVLLSLKIMRFIYCYFNKGQPVGQIYT